MTISTKVFGLMAAAALTACASATGVDATSRFDVFDTATTGDLTGYDQVYLAPIAVSDEIIDRVGYRTRGNNDSVRPLTERDIEGRVDRLQRDLASAISQNAELVRRPGEGVLTISVELTDIDANRPTQGDLRDQPGLSMNSRYTGGGSATVTFSENDRVLATASDSNMGDRNLRELTPAIWGETDRFFDRFANKIASLLG